jgi:hypothetical protein
VAFRVLGLIRLAPLLYGVLACLGLYLGGRRWPGRFGGAAAVGLYCSSGAAILFAWRNYMPTFTEAAFQVANPPRRWRAFRPPTEVTCTAHYQLPCPGSDRCGQRPTSSRPVASSVQPHRLNTMSRVPFMACLQ